MFTILAIVDSYMRLDSMMNPKMQYDEICDFLSRVFKGKKTIVCSNIYRKLKQKCFKDSDVYIVKGEKIQNIKTSVKYSLDEYIKDNKDSAENIFVMGNAKLYNKVIEVAKKIILISVKEKLKDANENFISFDTSLYICHKIITMVKFNLLFTIKEYTLIS